MLHAQFEELDNFLLDSENFNNSEREAIIEFCFKALPIEE